MSELSVQLQQLRNRLATEKGWVPHEFWGYTTVVTDRIMSVRDYNNDGFRELRDEFIARFREAGIDAHVDNKIAFGFTRGAEVLYVGFYDWHVDLGTSVRPDSWLKPRRAPVVSTEAG